MKVCHLISGDLWAGAEVQAFTMLGSLATEPDIELFAIVLNEGILAGKLRDIGLTVHICDETKLSFSSLYDAIMEILRANPVDVIHSHRTKEHVLAGLIRRNGAARHAISSVHGMPETPGVIPTMKRLIYRHLESLVFKRYFDRILPVSHDIATEMAKRFGSDKVAAVHNAIDIDRIKITRSADKVREEFHIGPHAPVIGTAGRMVPVKRYDRFLRMAQMILQSIPEAIFVIGGDGPLLDRLKQTAADMGISKHVVFTGFREDVIDLINCFDLLVISSRHEGIPMVVLEAMSLGKTVVAFNVGGLSEIIEHDSSGLLVEAENTQALAAACVKILADSNRRKNMESAGVERISRLFSTVAQRAQLLDHYHAVTSMISSEERLVLKS